MKNWFWLVLLFIFIPACATDDITSDQIERQRLLVDVATIEQSSINQKLELSGQVLPRNQVPLVTALPLEVKELHVEVGQTVEAGERLLTLEDREALRQLNQARSAVTQLEKALAQAREINQSIASNVGNLQELQQELQKSIDRSRAVIDELNRDELEDSLIDLLQTSLEVSLNQAELAQAASSGNFTLVNTIELEIQLESAENAVKQAEEAVQSSNVVAPITGVVSQVDVTVGQTALPSQPLIVISDLAKMDAVFSVNSFQVAKLTSGLPATLSITGIDDTLTGAISTISPVINPQTNTFSVLVPLENESLRLKGGMRTNAVIDLDTITETIVVPANGLLYESGEPYVFVVTENTARRQEVELGSREGEWIEVISGLEENDQIVTTGKERLTDGSEITIRSE
ncbi:efflux RND transporter periplasmic adaptor subunit [Halalkalibacter alkalisediminis]|uniref:Efflux RND transporter periplasmic adaptor subunit n=1 Tax=Halalkalibacter alkalisediminis TaxID=935616 RepID=A0ABV6NA88_9BACI|nr:efflux RND transporter periplasmic adaptor subunit [Halalkalibacter alkalisediminis]